MRRLTSAIGTKRTNWGRGRMSGLEGRADKVLALSIASVFEVRRYAETIVLNQ